MNSAKKAEISWEAARDPLARLLHGDTRRSVVEALMERPGEALKGLRKAMRSHTFAAGAERISLRQAVDALDSRSRAEGLHVIHGWDFKAQRRPADIAPVLLLDYVVRGGIPEDRTRAALEVILDHYCLAILALFAVRAWDDGDPAARLDDLNGLIAELNGDGGSGHRVVEDVGTLLILAVAYFHPEEHAYDELLAKVRTLDATHALTVALPAAPVLASHLRWGYRFMYRQDVGRMRSDNVVDYPWVLFSLLTLARAYAAACVGPADQRGPGRLRLADALFNGLSADPHAFIGKPPAFLAPLAREHDELRALLIRHRDELLSDSASFMPTKATFSPMAFGCNFLSNASVASAVLAVQGGDPNPSLDTLLRHHGGGGGSSWAESFARRLMEYASVPERLGAGQAPLLVYDPFDGVHHYNAVTRALTGQVSAPGVEHQTKPTTAKGKSSD